MPNLEDHEDYSRKKYGESFTKVHQWMDEPSQILGASHRRIRHDPKTTPQQAADLFGPKAFNICLDHIILDIEEMNKKKQRKNSPMLTCRMTESLLNALEQYAAFLGKDKSVVIRECIIELMAQKAPYILFKRFQEYSISRDPFEVKKCEKCRRKDEVVLYHVDLDINNISNDNLIVLCKKCQSRLEDFRKRYKRKESFFEWFFD